MTNQEMFEARKEPVEDLENEALKLGRRTRVSILNHHIKPGISHVYDDGSYRVIMANRFSDYAIKYSDTWNRYVELQRNEARNYLNYLVLRTHAEYGWPLPLFE